MSCKNGADSNQKTVVESSQIVHSSDTASVYNFSDFPVDTIKGKIVKPNFENKPLAHKYGLNYPPDGVEKLDFAGHFAVVRFQHPADDIGGVMVDFVNGDIFELPKCTLGYAYTKTSRLLIVNPPSKTGQENNCYYCKTQYWIWDDSVKEFRNLSKKPEPTWKEDHLETTEIICDMVYKNKGYKITLRRFNEDNQDETVPNSLFVFSKLTNGKYLPLFTDSIFNSVQDIQFTDFNNDHVRDILVQNFSDVRSNWTFYLYLVDTAHNRLKKIKGFEEIKSPHYLPQYNLIDNYVMSGKIWTGFYKIQGDSVRDFGIVIYDEQKDDDSYGRAYKKAIKSILAAGH